MKKEVSDFLNELNDEDIKEFKEFLESRKAGKWVFRHGHYLIKGLVFLVTSWIIFENFIKHLFLKISH